MDISKILLHGCIFSAILTLALLIIGLKSPRLMLQDYPKSIRDAAPPKTKEEKRQGIIFGIPFFLNFVGYPLGIAIYTASHQYQTFLQTFSLIWGITLFGNLYDLVVLDWLIICFITPKLVVIPGTEGTKGYKDYYFHFIGFLKGLLITFILSMVLSGIVYLIA